MFPSPNYPNYTPEQKQQAREAQRNNSYISLTWQLFNNYLHEYQNDPRKALELAQAAIEVWKEFEDGQIMEYPEPPMNAMNDIVVDNSVGSKGFMEAMVKAGEAMARKMREVRREDVEDSMMKVGLNPNSLDLEIDAEFHNPPQEGLASPTSDPKGGG